MQYNYFIPLDDSIQVDVTDFVIPGLGFEDVVSLDLNKSAFGNADGSQPEAGIVLQDQDNRIWGYPLHCCCWDILSSAYSTSRPGKEIDVQALFDLCRSQPVRLGVISWGHDYGRVAEGEKTDQVSFGEEPWSAPDSDDELKETYLQDPYHIPELANIFRTGSEQTIEPPGHHNQSIIARNGNMTDPLALLPAEILAAVFMHLNTRDVRNVRLASRCAASLELPPKFWRSRFMSDHEFSWAFEANSHPVSSKPWKLMYLRTKGIVNADGVQNRKRIWNLAHRLCNHLDLRLASNICYGTPCITSMELEGIADALDWSTNSSMLSQSSHRFVRGSRALFERRVNVPQVPFRILVSHVHLYDTRYISGIRMVKKDEPAIILGYPRSENEEEIIWESSEQTESGFAGFQVAADARGICGLAVLSTAGFLSSWTGEHHHAAKGRVTAVAHDPTDELKPITHLKGGFDASPPVCLRFVR